MKTWIKVANSDDVSANGGGCVKLGGLHGGVQIAVFKLQPPGGETTWYAVQNRCPHDRRQVLSSGLTGDVQGEPKVACPLHKNTFSLRTGAHLGGGLADRDWTLETFPVKEVEGVVFVEFDTARLTLPPTGVSGEPDHPYEHGLSN
jgi:nitrite reductase (NADH) small subunit